MRRLFKLHSRLFKVGACTTVIGSTMLAFQNDFSEITRPILFWNKMFPIYLSYKFNEWYDNNNAGNWELIHLKYAPKVLATILELKGIYIKIGQVMSQRPDMAPEIYRQAFQVLLDGVQGLSGQDARSMVEKNLGVPIESVFSYFNDIPIGAASIAQAHYAVLLDGREVVVKVQHPNAFEEFKSDIKTLNTFVRLAQPEQELVLDEFEQQFLLEFDFEREAWALETIHNNISNDFPDVIIPKPIPGLVKKNILVMDFVPGVKLIDAVIKQAEDTATFFGMTLKELQHMSYNPKWLFKAKYFGYKACQKFKYLKSLLYNSIVPLLGAFKFKLEPIQYPLNIEKLYDQLLQVHGKQLLIDGIFNADPHPGNILITPNGKLGLIDYGQIKTVSVKERRDIAEILLSLSKGENGKSELVEKARQVGFATQTNNVDVLYKSCVLAFDRDDLEMTEGMGLNAYVAELGKRDQSKSIPEQFIMAVRMCIILRGLSAILGPHHEPISIANRWKQLAKRNISMFPVNEVADREKPCYHPQIVPGLVQDLPLFA